MCIMSLKGFLYHWQNLEWNAFEDQLADNCEFEIVWIGMKFNKEEFSQLIQTITEEHPWHTNNKLIDEIIIEDYTISTISRLWPDDGPPDFEIIVAKWSNGKIEKGCGYSNQRLDNKLAKKWIESFKIDKKRIRIRFRNLG